VPAKKKLYVVDIETSGDFPWTGELVAVGINDKVYKAKEGRARMKQILSRPSIVVAHSNYDLRWVILDGLHQGWLDSVEDIHPELEFHDTKVMAFMLDSTQELNLDFLCQKYLGSPALWKPIRSVKNKVYWERKDGEVVPIEEAPWDEMEEYNTQDILETGKLYHELKKLMQEGKDGQELWETFFIPEEMPFSKILVEMEVEGMPFNREEAEAMLAKAEGEWERLQRELEAEVNSIYFNLKRKDYVSAFLYNELATFEGKWEIPLKHDHSIPKDVWEAAVREILPDDVRVDKITHKYVHGSQVIEGRAYPVPKVWYPKGKEPQRPTVKAEVLTLHHGEDPWVQKYLRWQSLNTLITSYLTVWLEAEHNGRLHGRFDQARAQTGRLASREPNLQSVPVTMDFDVRALFQGDLILGDYSGLDARWAADMSQDPVMMDVYLNDKDFYGVLASKIWGGPPTKKNDLRALVKILFLSQNYGAGAPSIADDISISGLGKTTVQEARKFLDDLAEGLPTLFAWRREVEAQALIDGYVTTVTGRRRYLPDLYSTQQGKQRRAVRQCVASAVQGSGADLVRRAMLAVRREVPYKVAHFVLQVHDEIVWERGPAWDDSWLPKIKELCETGFDIPSTLEFPFPCQLMDSWAEKDAVGARGFRINTSGGVNATGSR
jgi:DNA polymerase I-like protein with 3'-5' exonuclease and polymerase domains